MSNDVEYAFPFRTPEDRDGEYFQYYGMTLRDYFAAKAMASLISYGDLRDVMPEPRLAEEAYKYADAMLAQRNKQ